MTRSARIARIVKLKKLVENQAIAQMRQARSKLESAQALHQHLTVHGQRYEQDADSVSVSRGPSSTAGMYHRYRSFLSRLNEAIGQQQRQIELDQHQVGVTEARWRQRRAQSQAAETFMDRVVQAETQQAERREKRQAEDQFATRHHGRSVQR